MNKQLHYSLTLPVELPNILHALVTGLCSEVTYWMDRDCGEVVLEPLARYAANHICCAQCPYCSSCPAASPYDNDPYVYQCYCHLCEQLGIEPLDKDELEALNEQDNI